MEPSGLLLYNGRLNERHDFLAVEIIQGQVQLKYSTGRLGVTPNPCHGVCAVGAVRRPSQSRGRRVLPWMEPVLRKTGLREVLVSVSGWPRGWVSVPGPSLHLGMQAQQWTWEHKPGQTLLVSLLLFCPVLSL